MHEPRGKRACMQAVSALKSRNVLFDFTALKRSSQDLRNNLWACIEKAYERGFQSLREIYSGFIRLVDWIEHPQRITKQERSIVASFLRELSARLKIEAAEVTA